MVLRAYYIGLLSVVLISAIFAMSINLLAGWVGLVSLGHAGILAAAGYGVGYVASQAGGYGTQLLAGAALGLGASLVFGLLAMRASGVGFLMITLALGMVVWGLAYRLVAVTGGDTGIRGIYRPAALRPYWNYYYLCLAVFAVCSVLMWLISRSAAGLTFRGIRESESRMTALGYNLAGYKLYAFLLSGAFATTAGMLLVYYHEFISPTTAAFAQSGSGLLMVILGGVSTLAGPVVGAAVLVALEYVVGGAFERWQTVAGVVFVVVILFARRGLVGTLARAWRAGRTSSRKESPS
jgi:branched-chain amino acid transport system permease protein